MKTKKVCSRIAALLLAVCMLVQIAPVPDARAAVTPDANGVITYLFNSSTSGGSALAKTDIDKYGWELNLLESCARIVYNRASDGWTNVRECISPAIDGASPARRYIALDLDVPKSGYYNVEVIAGVQSKTTEFKLYMNGKLGNTATFNTTKANHSVGVFYLPKGANTLKIETTATDAAYIVWPKLYGAVLSPVEYPPMETLVLDFRSNAVVTSLLDMTMRDQGIRFVSDGSTCDGNGVNYTTFVDGRKFATIGFHWAANKTANFDFKAPETANYDIVIPIEDNPNHGLVAEVAVNDAVAATVDTARSNSRLKGVNKYTSKIIKNVGLNQGYNIMKFTSKSGCDNSGGVWNLYFKEAIHLVDPIATASGTGMWSVNAANTTASVNGNKISFAKGQKVTFNIKAPEYGLYYIYVNAKNTANGFGGDVATQGGVTRFADWGLSYSDEAADTVVTRAIGPMWLRANTNETIALTETVSANSVLEISDIEIHKVKQNLWLIDNAVQNFGEINIKEDSWELDAQYSDPGQYQRLMMGNYAGALTYLNATRTANHADLNLNTGRIAIKVQIPSDGVYDISGSFRRNSNATNVVVTIPGTEFNKAVELNLQGADRIEDNVSIGSVMLTEGEHTFVFTKGTGGNYFYPAQLNLKANPAPSGVRLDINSRQMLVGDSSPIHTDIAMNSGDVITVPVADSGDEDTGYIKLTSSNTNVAAINNGVLTAVSAGTAKITAEAHIYGTIFTKEVVVTVSDKSQSNGFVLTVDKPFAIAQNVRKDVLIQGAVDNIVVDLNKATEITATSSDESVAKVEIVKRKGNVYARVNSEAPDADSAQTEITVTAVYDDKTASVAFPITVEKAPASSAPIFIDFATPTASNFEALDIDVHGWELNDELNDPVLYEKIAAGHSSKGTAHTLFHFGWDMDTGIGEKAYINIKIPKTGWYGTKFLGCYYGNYGATVSFHIDGKYIGDFDFENKNDVNNAIYNIEPRMRDIYLEEGVHVLKVERINPRININHTRNTLVYLYNMQFIPLVEPTTIVGVDVECDRDKMLLMGDSAQMGYSLRMSDGTDYFFPILSENQGGMSIQALTPDRVSYTDGIINANGYGTGVFEISAERPDEDVYTANWNIDVAKGMSIDFSMGRSAGAETVKLAEANWTVDSANTSDSVENADVFKVSNDLGLQAKFNANDILAIDVNVLESGIFDIDAVGSTNEDGATAAMYLDSTYLGEFDFSGDKASEVRQQLNSIELSKGMHKLYIKRTNVTGGNAIFLDRVVLTKTDRLSQFASISIQADSDQVVYNHTMQATATVYMDNGRVQHFGKKLDGSIDDQNKLVYSSSDDSVFTVDENGLLSGIAEGEADLKVDVVLRGDAFSASQKFETIRVLELTVADELFATRNEIVSTTISAVLDDMPVDPSLATYVAIIPEDDTKAEGYAEIDAESHTVTVNFKGLRTGTHNVTVEACIDGVIGRVTVPLQIFAPAESKRDLDINFVTGYSGSPDGATIAADGWQVNYQLTDEAIPKTAQWSIGASGLNYHALQNQKMVLDFMVRETGSYKLDFYGGRVGNYGQIAAIYLDDMYLGEFDFAHPTDDPNARINSELKRMNSVTLTPGTHTITFKRINESNYRHSFIYAMEFDFTELAEPLFFDKTEVSVAKETLVVGESIAITTQATMSDGSVRYMGKLMDGSDDPNNWISVENSNPAVASIENGRITARAAGETTITVNAMVDGETKSDSVTIKVENEAIGSIDAALSGDVYVNKSVDLSVIATSENGNPIDADSLTVSATTENTDIVKIEGTKVTGLAAGNATIEVTATLNGKSATDTIEVTVTDDGMVGIVVKALPRLIRPDSKGTKIVVEGGSFLGEKLDLSGATITYTTEATDIIELAADGYVTPKAIGEALVNVTVEVNGVTFEGSINIVVTNGKVGSSYYTESKVAAAKENIATYDWARNEAKSIIAKADKYLDMDDFLWNSVTTQELPRSTTVGFAYDPEAVLCRYCGVDLGRVYSNPIYSYNVDPINEPWKIQCKSCRRKFPSNDFGSFYALGIDEYGNWSYKKSLAENQKIVDEGGRGYLVNLLYPEVASVETINGGKGLNPLTETVEGWGVDDGYGYRTGHVYKGTNIGDVDEVHSYIAMYNRFIMGTDTLFDTVVQTLSQAYLFTDDARYGRACAIVIDRLADVYPDMEIEPHWQYKHAGEKGRGKLEGRIWEPDTLAKWIAAYDAVWPMYDDPYVINFLNEKAKKYNMENDKSTPELIRHNIEDGIIRETVQALKDGKLYGNFGLHQVPVTYAGIVLDTMPESKEILDFLMRYDDFHLYPSHDKHTGGEILHKIYNDVDRNGGTKEGTSPNYQNLWYNTMADIANILNGYEGYAAADLFQNVKLNQMLKNQMNYIMMRRTSLAVGDSGVMAGLATIMPSPAHLINAFYATNDPVFAQMIYFQNGNKTTGLKRGLYDKDPEKIAADVQNVIDTYGEYPFDDSILMAGTGFASLRDGSLYGQGSIAEHDNQRGFWMTYGLAGIHGHKDTMNLGVYAYGLDFAPDFGYPDPATLNDQHRNWGMSTLSHNLVVVNDKPHSALNNPGKPLHFDDTDRVKVMDSEAPEISSATDIYRRTVVMIEVNDDESYGVDFFRVKGGDEHLYSFHAQSDTIGDWAGFKPQIQETGSYAGENVPYETAGNTSGYTYLTDVRKDTEPGTGEVMVEFDITDYRKAIKDSSDMHLRLTMLNDFDLTNVSLAKGEPPNKDGNPDWIEFFLARRSGNNLDSTFTTVIEPYQGDRYITDTQQISIERIGGEMEKADDVARAIKVTLDNGREDYVVYATNNNVEYLVDGNFTFKGFVGVHSVMGEDVLYSYINHGTKIGDVETVSEYTGEVVEFSKGMSFDNFLVVRFDNAESVDLDNLLGRHIYVENDGAQSGAYKIEGVTDNTDGTVTLDLGGVTLVRSADNITAESADFIYNVARGQWFNIPLSEFVDAAPVVSDIDNAVAMVGRKFTQSVSAQSKRGNEITYVATALPRGATLDSETGLITWSPDKYQIGAHHFSITAVDGELKTTVHFEVNVYASSGGSGNTNSGSTTPSAPSTPSTPSTPSEGGSAGGGSAGGGGGSTTPSTPSTPTTPEAPDEPETPDAPATGEGEDAPDVPETPAEKFVDMGNHTWAKDAVYTLVDKGVVNGTSSNTYAPANNIKRADFAIMLVRAFGITEGEGENFADVDANKYYAEELRLAKAAGIVNGVGNDKFNPEGEITRQDMMLMLSRALDAMEVELSEADLSALADFADAAQISDYAADAVSRMIKDGIIAGSNGKINPLAKATRAEIAVMLNRVLAK